MRQPLYLKTDTNLATKTIHSVAQTMKYPLNIIVRLGSFITNSLKDSNITYLLVSFFLSPIVYNTKNGLAIVSVKTVNGIQ